MNNEICHSEVRNPQQGLNDIKERINIHTSPRLSFFFCIIRKQDEEADELLIID